MHRFNTRTAIFNKYHINTRHELLYSSQNFSSGSFFVCKLIHAHFLLQQKLHKDSRGKKKSEL